MAYDKDYSKIEISEEDLTETHRIIIEGFMREGEFRSREALITFLENDVARYLEENESESDINMDWVDGVRYAIHVLREVHLDAI